MEGPLALSRTRAFIGSLAASRSTQPIAICLLAIACSSYPGATENVTISEYRSEIEQKQFPSREEAEHYCAALNQRIHAISSSDDLIEVEKVEFVPASVPGLLPLVSSAWKAALDVTVRIDAATGVGKRAAVILLRDSSDAVIAEADLEFNVSKSRSHAKARNGVAWLFFGLLGLAIAHSSLEEAGPIAVLLMLMSLSMILTGCASLFEAIKSL